MKIERPGTGDLIRDSEDAGTAIFAALNRNKRSLALDLKRQENVEALQSVVEETDVFIENLGRNATERLGIATRTSPRRCRG